MPTLKLNTIMNRLARSGLALLLVAALLSMRMSALTTEHFVTPCQDFLKDTSTISAESTPGKAGVLKVKPKRAFDFTPCEATESQIILAEAQELPTVYACLFLPEVYLDILVPPDIRS